MKITNPRSYPLVFGSHRAAAGETIEVPDDVGEAAVDSGVWEKARKSKSADSGDVKES